MSDLDRRRFLLAAGLIPAAVLALSGCNDDGDDGDGEDGGDDDSGGGGGY